MPYFSVIIPTYNRASRIAKAIDSVLAQSFEDWELIIIDDGSTDETKEQVDQYEDNRITYIFQENAERGAARNKGVKNAKGVYVFFLDSDDYIYPNYLVHASDRLSQLTEPEFFHIRYHEMHDNKARFPATLNKADILQKTTIQNRFACQFFLRTDIARETPFSENRRLKIGEDWGVILRIAVRYPLHFSNEYLGVIVQHNDRSMQLASAETILNSRDSLLNYLNEDELVSEEIKGNVSAELTSLAALSSALNKDKRAAKELLLEAIKKRPYLRWTKRTLAIYKKLAIG
jgi:glycosyltransferase involved in cell wall biosynthesis